MKGDLKKGVTHMSTTSKVSKILSLTLLLGITVMSNSYTSDSLRDYFSNNSNTVNFDGSTIMVDGENKTSVIKPEEFIIDSDNTSSRPSNIGVVVLANIDGINNLYLQQLSADSNIHTSITFSMLLNYNIFQQ